MPEIDERYRLLFEANPQPMWLYDAQTLRFIEVNDAAVAHYGYSRQEFLSMTLKDIRPPEDALTLQQHVQSIEDSPDGGRVWRHRKKDGSIIAVDVMGRSLEFAGRRVRFALIRDITDLKTAHEALGRKVYRLQTLHGIDRAILGAQSSADIARSTLSRIRGLLPCDRASVVLFDQPTGSARYLAVDAEGSIGPTEETVLPLGEFPEPEALAAGGLTRIDDLLRDRQPEPVSAIRERLVTAGIRSVVAAPLVADGEVLGVLSVSATAVGAFGEEHEEIAGEVAAQLAIAVRHSWLREELLRALQIERESVRRLQELDHLKGLFLTAVSHELRTPLTTILGNALTLEQRGGELPPDTQAELVSSLSANARRLNRLLADLLDVDRLTRGAREPVRQLVDVGALVYSLVLEADGLRGRTVHVEAPRMIVSVDPAKVERIIDNLLANAARYTPPDSPVWVRVGEWEGGVVIVVEDAGPGVPDHLKRSIFEPFAQGEGVAVHSPGVGIGLALVARFAELHGGRAWVEDRPGGGAAFKVVLATPEPPLREGDATALARTEGTA